MRPHGFLRTMLLLLFLAACVGTGIELFLLEHVEDWQQWIPVALLGIGLASGTAAGLRPRRRSLLALRALAGAFAVSGLVGLYLHYTGNVAFELEVEPGLGGLELVWAALTGATPALAPATMIWLGALGFLFAWDHPALERRDAETEEPTRTEGGRT